VSVDILLEVILENFCIFLNASESFEIELPTHEKSMLLSTKELSLGDKIK
jgi:hypothetical protein